MDETNKQISDKCGIAAVEKQINHILFCNLIKSSRKSPIIL